ncbi:hypothetical protein J2786_003048 [Chryseobacterium vietnamense]|uniref:Uncharacterized protein n=1 Tax=Chryseobacterium vietnamense TaxID=866785 RepID=A0ACC6JAV8_9FLAO|nr:hypothetical protein [Chryseobacterium vietnamense]
MISDGIQIFSLENKFWHLHINLTEIRPKIGHHTTLKMQMQTLFERHFTN